MEAWLNWGKRWAWKLSVCVLMSMPLASADAGICTNILASLLHPLRTISSVKITQASRLRDLQSLNLSDTEVAHISLGDGAGVLLTSQEGHMKAMVYWPDRDSSRRDENNSLEFQELDLEKSWLSQIPSHGELSNLFGRMTFQTTAFSKVIAQTKHLLNPFRNFEVFDLHSSAASILKNQFRTGQNRTLAFEGGIQPFLKSNSKKISRQNRAVYLRRELARWMALWIAPTLGLLVSPKPFGTYSVVLNQNVGPLVRGVVLPFDRNYYELSRKSDYALLPYIDHAATYKFGDPAVRSEFLWLAGSNFNEAVWWRHLSPLNSLPSSSQIQIEPRQMGATPPPRSYAFWMPSRLSELRRAMKSAEQLSKFVDAVVQSDWKPTGIYSSEANMTEDVYLPNKTLQYLLPKEAHWKTDERLRLDAQFLSFLFEQPEVVQHKEWPIWILKLKRKLIQESKKLPKFDGHTMFDSYPYEGIEGPAFMRLYLDDNRELAIRERELLEKFVSEPHFGNMANRILSHHQSIESIPVLITNFEKLYSSKDRSNEDEVQRLLSLFTSILQMNHEKAKLFYDTYAKRVAEMLASSNAPISEISFSVLVSELDPSFQEPFSRELIKAFLESKERSYPKNFLFLSKVIQMAKLSVEEKATVEQRILAYLHQDAKYERFGSETIYSTFAELGSFDFLLHTLERQIEKLGDMKADFMLYDVRECVQEIGRTLDALETMDLSDSQRLRLRSIHLVDTHDSDYKSIFDRINQFGSKE